MVISKASIHAIRALMFVATQGGEGYVPVRVISEELGVSHAFLGKILQQLTEKGLLRSHRGPRGGVAFARSPESITVLDVVEVLEGGELFDACLLGLPGCGSSDPCPLHERWAPVREAMHEQFEQTTIASMAQQVRSGTHRLHADPRGDDASSRGAG